MTSAPCNWPQKTANPTATSAALTDRSFGNIFLPVIRSETSQVNRRVRSREREAKMRTRFVAGHDAISLPTISFAFSCKSEISHPRNAFPDQLGNGRARSGRSEPRAKKRRPKNFQILTKFRSKAANLPHRNYPRLKSSKSTLPYLRAIHPPPGPGDPKNSRILVNIPPLVKY